MEVECEAVLGRVALGHGELSTAAVATGLLGSAEAKIGKCDVSQNRLQRFGESEASHGHTDSAMVAAWTSSRAGWPPSTAMRPSRLARLPIE